MASQKLSNPGANHHRRRSSNVLPAQRSSSIDYGPSGLFQVRSFAQPLGSIPGTPTGGMSLSRSPSPQGGSASPGLSIPPDGAGRVTTMSYGEVDGVGMDVTWASAQSRSAQSNGYPSFQTVNRGFLKRHFRTFSNSLPRFNRAASKDYAEKEKLGRGRLPLNPTDMLRNIVAILWRFIWRMRLRLTIVTTFVTMIVLFYATRRLRGKAR